MSDARTASSETIDTLWAYAYEESFLEDVHLLLFGGYTRARSEINADCEENPITGFLKKAIKIELRNKNYLGRYEIEEQRPVDANGRTGDDRQRIDLVFEANDPQMKREFCCEAKRLKTSTNTIVKYTGGEGLGCFVKGEYAADQPLGAMLGYIQSSGMSYWHGELERKLGATHEVNLQTALVPITVISELAHEWHSTHGRADGTSIEVFHIFLDCA